jgi:hypothetical protein
MEMILQCQLVEHTNARIQLVRHPQRLFNRAGPSTARTRQTGWPYFHNHGASWSVIT